MKIKLLSVILSAVIIILFVQAFSVSSAGVAPKIVKPEISEIKKHEIYQKLNDLYNLPNHEFMKKKVNELLVEMDQNELIQLSAEIADVNEENFDNEVMVVVPYLKSKWKNIEFPFDAISLVTDQNYNWKFRAFMLDTLTSNTEKYMNSIKFNDGVNKLIHSSSEQSLLKRYALLKLKHTNEETIEKYELIKIVNNENENSIVRGAAITAMSRLGDRNYDNVVTTIIENPEKYDSIILRHALASYSKQKQSVEHVDQYNKIAKNTTDSEVFNTSIYSLGNIGGLKATKALVEIYSNNQDKDIFLYSFQKNIDSLEKLIVIENDEEFLKKIIKIIGLLNLHTFQDKLYEIKKNTNDSELITLIDETSEGFDTNFDVEGISKKWLID